MKNKFGFGLILTLMILLVSCGVYETIQNFARLDFRIDSYNNFRVADVSLDRKNNLDDLSSIDYVKLTGAFVSGELPFSFVINVAAANPNDGTGGYPATDISVKSFPFRVLIDDKEILNGNIDEPFTVPGVGENKNISIRVDVDILKFFRDKSFENLAELLLAVSNKENARSRISLFAKPILGTPVGEIEYPREIEISHEFK